MSVLQVVALPELDGCNKLTDAVRPHCSCSRHVLPSVPEDDTDSVTAPKSCAVIEISFVFVGLLPV